MFKCLMFSFLFWCLPVFELYPQDIYYRYLSEENLAQFIDTSSRITFKGDATTNFKTYFNYVLKFFPKMEYNKIEVLFKPSNKIAETKPKFGSMFRLSQNRTYKIIFSTQATSALDSVTIKNLGTDERTGLIAREISHVENLSTSGFFDIFSWYIKRLSRKGRNKIEHDVELKVLEVGLGYQLLALRKTCDELLNISRWTNAKAYGSYFKHYRNRYMDAENIGIFISDLPVYTTNNYK